MKNKLLRISNLIMVCFTVAFLFFGFTQIHTAYAAETDTSSAIMYELTSDPRFNKDDYPDKPIDYSLQVIQIGEDINKNLYLYVYQPSHNSIDLLGTAVSISYGFSSNGAGLSPKMYELELVSTSGVFDKYLVKGMKDNTTSGTDGQRYYNIVTIYRAFNEVIDTPVDYGETGEVGYSVGQQWYAHDVNNSVQYDMGTFKTLQVNLNIVSFMEFNNGFQLKNILGGFDKGRAFFAAFNVAEYVVQHIYDADIYFKTRWVEKHLSGTPAKLTYKYGEYQDKTITLKEEDTMSYKAGGFGGREYEWNRILPAKNFVKIAEDQHVIFDSGAKDVINASQWVFSFYETESSDYVSMSSQINYYDEVDAFAVLRLHFMDTSGIVYDLGVVSDKVNSTKDPTGTGDPKAWAEIFEEFWELFLKVISVIGVVILIVFILQLLGILSPVFKAIGFIFKAILSVIALPFKLIGGLFKNEKPKKHN